jgi:hypothetical protein
MKHFPTNTVATAVAAPLEWQPDLERLRTEIVTARRAGRTDDLAIAEVECWIDLIHAEISARRDHLDDPELGKLMRWKADLTAMLKL